MTPNKKMIGILLLILVVATILFFKTNLLHFIDTRPAKNNNASSSLNLESTTLDNKDSSDKTLSHSECEHLYKEGQTDQNLLIDKKYAISAYLKKLQKEGLDYNQLQLVGDAAGLTNPEFVNAMFGLNQGIFIHSQSNNVLLLADEYQKRPSVTSEERIYLDNAIERKNYSDIARAIQQNKLNANGLIYGSPILDYAISLNHKIELSELRELVDAGIAIDLKTIVTAVKSDLPFESIQYLSNNYKNPLNETWTENGTPMNLSLLAAQKLKPNLFHYFNTEKQINPYISTNSGSNTLLDALPTPTTNEERKLVENFAKGAFAFGLTPINYSTTEKLKQSLSEETKKQYAAQLVPAKRPDDDILKQGEELKAIMSQFDKKITLTKLTMSKCLTDQGYSLDNFVSESLRNKIASKSLSLKTKRMLRDFIQQNWMRIGKDGTLSKENNVSLPVPTQDSPERSMMKAKLFDLFTTKQWEASSKQCESIGEEWCYNILLNAYLWSEKPELTMINSLADKGATLDPFLLLTLARNGNAELIQQLRSRGLDMHYQNNMGENALSVAVSNLNNANMVQFLIDQQVPIKPDTPSFDPLDIALEQLDFFSTLNKEPNNARFNNILLLLQAGAPIEESHREKLAELKITNPAAYEELLKFIPNLESYFN